MPEPSELFTNVYVKGYGVEVCLLSYIYFIVRYSVCFDFFLLLSAKVTEDALYLNLLTCDRYMLFSFPVSGVVNICSFSCMPCLTVSMMDQGFC